MNRFTLMDNPAAEARIQKDLDYILNAVVACAEGEGYLEVIYLLGGYARGDGTAVEKVPGSWRGFNDYDLLLVFRTLPKDFGPYRSLAKRLASEVEINSVDLGLVTLSQLQRGEPTLFWYEFYEAHKVLWRKEDRNIPRLPRLRVKELDKLEAPRFLHNRGMALLWAALRLWPSGPPYASELTQDAGALQFAQIAAHKAVLAAGEAPLLYRGEWSLSQAGRAALVESVPWFDDSGLARYRAAVVFRKHPSKAKASDIANLWIQARSDLEHSMQTVQGWWLGVEMNGWEGQRSRLRKIAIKQRLCKPRKMALWILGRQPFDRSEPGWFAELSRLLFPGPQGDPWRVSYGDWRDSVQRLRRAWHP